MVLPLNAGTSDPADETVNTWPGALQRPSVKKVVMLPAAVAPPVTEEPVMVRVPIDFATLVPASERRSSQLAT